MSINRASTWPADAPPGTREKVPFNDTGVQRPGPAAEVEGAVVTLPPVVDGCVLLPGASVVATGVVGGVDRFDGEELQAAAMSATAVKATGVRAVRRMDSNLTVAIRRSAE
ncbi:MAG TPA: hypothetical protein VNF71_04680 [Acidimicrobiales bacterium]|nr:hypothetical protein [Acidimicrobiales bacterium]